MAPDACVVIRFSDAEENSGDDGRSTFGELLSADAAGDSVGDAPYNHAHLSFGLSCGYTRRRFGRRIARCTVSQTRRPRRLCRNMILSRGRRVGRVRPQQPRPSRHVRWTVARLQRQRRRRQQIARFPAVRTWSPLRSLGYIQMSLSYYCRGRERDVCDRKNRNDSSEYPVLTHFR